MSKIATYHITNGELCHYGVKGMRWGVRRNLKRLGKANASNDSDARAKAVAKLEKHRAKSTKKLTKLESKQPKLQKQVDKANTAIATKQAGAERRAAAYQRKAIGRFTRNSKREKYMIKAMKWDAKAKSYNAQALEAKVKLEQNRQMQEAFKKGISQIDNALVNKGRKYLNQ